MKLVELPPGKYTIDDPKPELYGIQNVLTFGSSGVSFKECNLYNCEFKQGKDLSIMIGKCFSTMMFC